MSKAKLTCKGAYFIPESQRKRTEKGLPKDTSLTVYPSSTWVTHVYDERHMELSKEARLWLGTDLALPLAAYGCSGFQLFTFSMTVNISATCPKLSQDDAGKWAGILPHLDSTHCKLASNSQQHHAQLWQRPWKATQESSHFRCSFIKTDLYRGAESSDLKSRDRLWFSNVLLSFSATQTTHVIKQIINKKFKKKTNVFLICCKNSVFI